MLCPVCLGEVTAGSGVVDPHYDSLGKTWCPMSGREPFVWDEASTRVAVCSRSGGYCELGCGARASNMHHRRNRSQGGGWSPTNVAHLCGSGTTGCHGWVTHNPVEAHDLGLTLWTGEEPADVPILTALGPVWLTDDICPPRPGWL